MFVTSKLYLQANTDVADAGVDPLQHALSRVVYGPREPRCLEYPDELGTESGQLAYYKAWPDVERVNGHMGPIGALLHYLGSGWKEPRWPLPGTVTPTPVSPAPAPVTPSVNPGSVMLPSASGEIVSMRRTGPFFMSVLWPFVGTYRDASGIARLLQWDGQKYIERWSGRCESVYHIQRRKNGRIMFSTECPAQVVVENADGSFTSKGLLGTSDSLAFDIWPIIPNEWIVFVASNVQFGSVYTYISTDDGESWHEYKKHAPTNGKFVQMCTDGQRYWIYGDRDGFPYLEDEGGKSVIWMKDYKDQTINYASIKDGLFTLGLNNIGPIIHDGTRRNGYVMYGTTSGMYHSGIDLKPPFVMQTDIHPQTGEGFAVASIWNESGYPNPQVARSKDRRTWPESNVVTVPFPSVQTLDWVDGGYVYAGGQFGQYGAVGYTKL